MKIDKDGEFHSYYINNVFEDDLIYHDISMDEGYGVLISDYSHRIIQHSIFTENILHNVNKEQVHTEEPNLIKLSIFKKRMMDQKGIKHMFTKGWKKHNRDYLISLQSDHLQVHELQIMPPRVYCHTLEPDLFNYRLKLNASVCTLDQDKTNIEIFQEKSVDEFDHFSFKVGNPFYMCQIVKPLTYEAKKVEINEANKKKVWITIGVVCGVFVVTGLIVMIICCKKKQKLDYNFQRIELYKTDLGDKTPPPIIYNPMANITTDMTTPNIDGGNNKLEHEEVVDKTQEKV